jgi:hypothetical protein
MMLPRKVAWVSLMGVALIASSTMATAQRQRFAPPDITLSQSVRPLRMQH